MTPEQLKKKWSMTESHLQVGDILLFHHRRSPLSKLIMWRSESYWSHCALVFKDQDVIKYGSPLVIEAFDSGIEVHRLQKYTERFDKYDVGVKRFPGLTTEQRAEFVKSFMLNHIDVPYDYGVLVTYLFSNVLKRFAPPLYRFVTKRLVKEDAFVCSSFIHNAFHAFKKHQSFNVKFKKVTELEQERLITPAMIAADKDFEWVFNKRK